jgi:hypothetical protein
MVGSRRASKGGAVGALGSKGEVGIGAVPVAGRTVWRRKMELTRGPTSQRDKKSEWLPFRDGH